MSSPDLHQTVQDHLLDCARYRGDVARKLDRIMFAVIVVATLKGLDLAGVIDILKAML